MEATSLDSGEFLPIIEAFYTVQGEGFHTGKAAYFIRIGGCDIGCSWCDTKFSWSAEHHLLMPVGEIVNSAKQHPAKAIVVTGGEPTLYNLEPLCSAMKNNGIQTFIETSGAYPLTGEWDWVCLSPKQQKPAHETLYNKADELKVIITETSDFEWAEENALKVNKSCKLYLQPEWSKYRRIILPVVDYVKQNPKWNVSLQTHKFMKIP